MAKWLITTGLVIVLLGLLWPVISKLGLGHLPGDFRIERPGSIFYFPLTTSILLSVLVSVLIWLFRR